ncbi:peptidase domain-containing ABC transporter, partial [Azospirillum sp.]|uniref:peptidase domain-containing ABC transporter n=1 Tax=Azospirillum sp. TaxID=34012 RepID=UPI002D31261C
MSESAVCAHTVVKSLALIAGKRGIGVIAEDLLKQYGIGDQEASTDQILGMAEGLGLSAKETTLSWEELVDLGGDFPVMLILKNGNAMVAVNTTAIEGVPVMILHDPLVPDDSMIAVDERRLTQAWDGRVMLLKRHYKLTDVEQPFGWRWFFPEIIRQRRLFRDIAIAAIMLSLFGLAAPILTQLILDKVVVHKAYGTLYVLAAGYVMVVLFQVVFNYLRGYMTLVVTNRIDSILNVRVFNRLISLPMHYFETASAGVVLRNVTQTSTIRNFLTGQVFSTLLECVTLAFLIPFMFYFHAPLAIIILGMTALLCVVFAVTTPYMKRKLATVAETEARRQAFLVETIHGMRTIKSLALDARQRKEWDNRTTQTLLRQFDVGRLMIGMQSVTHFLQVAINMVVVLFGAWFVLQGSLSVGSFIAMTMLTGRVVGPLVQVSQIFQSFQQVSLSLDMLGNIMNHPAEEGRSGIGTRPRIQGKVEFRNVRFRYPTGAAWALDDVSFKAEAGTILGIMGRSGSGKTTITRLLQKLHPIHGGSIRIDGHDLRDLDLDHLRSSIGVVLQESFLFRGSIRQNIAAGKPHATLEEIMRAARMAGATEFIERMPKGFDTLLEEGASNLSGGQRQRLAIARALLVDPPIL